MDNAGMELPRNYKWHEVWQQVLLRPSTETFTRILADPTASPRRAFTWVAVMALIGGLLQAVIMQIIGADAMTSAGISPVFGVLCGAIAAPVFGMLGLALGAAIYHGVARLFGGDGTFDRMVYAMGSVSAPVSLVSLILSALVTPASLSAQQGAPMLSLCVAPFSIALGFYSLFLYILAVKAVERLGTGQAVLTVLLPSIVLIAVVFGCIVLALIPFFMESSNLIR